MDNLCEIWQNAYKIVPDQLVQMQCVHRVVTAFNTNIDAVIKLSGTRLSELAKTVDLTTEDLQNPQTKINSPKDVVRGIVKCWTLGIAEEWLCEDKHVYERMRDILGYDRLQMGGQAGIIANVLAVCGAQNVLVHTNSHPKLQAEQFLNAANLLAIDAGGKLRKACEINRKEDEPLIHWIIEFDAGDVFEFAGTKFVCPKANRFIATYDTANIELKINPEFIRCLDAAGFDYMILSGFHNLTAERDGLRRIEEVLPLIKAWKQQNPRGIIHLELASTQDKVVRAAIIKYIAPVVDSIGLNEREALDALEIVSPEMFAIVDTQKLTSPILFKILKTLKEKLQTPRIQLHFFGMYLTLQNKDFAITPEENKRGMMLAATVAASKAGTGNLECTKNLLWAHGMPIVTAAIENLRNLADYLDDPTLASNGLATVDNTDLIAVPTILIDKPTTLVGMGDTISSISLVGAR